MLLSSAEEIKSDDFNTVSKKKKSSKKTLAKTTKEKREKKLTGADLAPKILSDGLWLYEDKYRELPNSRFRYYQAIRDYCFVREVPDILLLYQEVVAQFGFIVLFGQIFPLGAAFSMIANHVQVNN